MVIDSLELAVAGLLAILLTEYCHVRRLRVLVPAGLLAFALIAIITDQGLLFLSYEVKRAHEVIGR